MRLNRMLLPLLAGASLMGGNAQASGHGPIYGLATPTNAKGSWSLDYGAMGVQAGGRINAMARLMAAYGYTQDLQFSISAPLYRISPPRSSRTLRGLAMMPMTSDIEFMVADRFHHQDTGIGKRQEDTAYLAFSVPNADISRPGVFGALAHGDISRAVYLWEGVGYKAYAGGGSHPGNEIFYSVVLGFRPKAWQTEYPKPDVRLLLEITGEVQEHGEWLGVKDSASGGHRVFLMTGFLGTYRNLGFSAGIAFPVAQDVPSGTRRQQGRLAVDVTAFF